jgi:hypothetical protein
MGVYMICVPSRLNSASKGKFVQIGTISIQCLSAGFEGNGEFNLSGHHLYAMSKSARLLITLGLSTMVNILLSCIGYIHATTLRWALIQENRLHMNSNLRLFSTSKFYYPNKWYMNVVYLVGFTITFGSLTSITRDVNAEFRCDLKETEDTLFQQPDTHQDGLDFKAVEIISLGIGILLQAFVSTCAISKSAFVITWSSDPLTNAKAYHDSHGFPGAPTSLYRSNSLHSSCSESLSCTHSQISSPSECSSCQITYSFPEERQPSMLSALPNACRIRFIMWAFFGAFAMWSGTLAVINYKTDMSRKRSYNSDQGGKFGGQHFRYADLNSLLRLESIALLIQICVQSFICFNLHCVELLFNVSRDEATWRKATLVGMKTNPSPIKSFTTHWQSPVLMALKSLIQWVFGLLSKLIFLLIWTYSHW